MNNSALLTTESWFIPVDIVEMISIIFVIGSSALFLFLIIVDKTCHTIPMLLVANSCLVSFILGIDMINMNVFTLKNDLRQSAWKDSLCVVRGYIIYSLFALENYSYVLQSIYRYAIVVYPTHLFWQSSRTQILLIAASWIFSFVVPLPFFFTGEILYNIDNQICLIPLRLSFSTVFVPVGVYYIPVSMIFFVYYKLVRYVQDMNRRVTLTNSLARAKNELKMVRRTVILIIILFIVGFPYALFLFISYFTTPPKYHIRVARTFINMSLVVALIALFQFTEPLQKSAKKIFNSQPNGGIIPTLT